jgi:dihydropyrimidinase
MDDATLLRLMHAAVEVDGLVMVHAENDAMVTDATQRLVAEGKIGWQYHGQSRPILAEEEAVNRVIFLASEAGAPLYIVHCTSLGSIIKIEEARERQQTVYCETCPQYLILDDTVYEGMHPEHYILQPPLRYQFRLDEPIHRGDLWDSLENNLIDVISTDSCDYTLAQKTEHTEFTKTPGGLPGIETLLPLMYTRTIHEAMAELSLSDLVSKLSTNPARIFGLYPRKGILAIGSDADVVLYDPEPEGTISHKDLHYVADYSPYEGICVKGKVRMTISRGEIIYRDGEFLGKAGRGQFIPGQPLS